MSGSNWHFDVTFVQMFTLNQVMKITFKSFAEDVM